MADRGTIAVAFSGGPQALAAQQQVIYPLNSGLVRGFGSHPNVRVQGNPIFPLIPRAIRCVGIDSGLDRLSLNAGRDDTNGSPSAPSLYLPLGGTFRIRLPVKQGTRAVTVKIRQPSSLLARPTMTVRANASIGVNADVSATAPAGTGWVTIGPLTFTASANGGIVIELFAPWDGGESGTWFDSISVT